MKRRYIRRASLLQCPLSTWALVVVGLFQISVLGYLYTRVVQLNHENSYLFPNHYLQTPTQINTREASIPEDSRNVSRQLFNSWNRARYVCGRLIPPNGNVMMQDCRNPPRLYATTPTIDGTNMPPIVVRFQDNYKKHHLQNVSCSIPCQILPQAQRTSRNPATIDDTPFKFVVHSMEGSGYYSHLQVKPTGYRLYEFYATTSFQSEVPLPYYSPHDFNIQAPAIDYGKAIKGASFLANNCVSLNGREEVVQGLIDSGVIRVDSLSHCLHNADSPKGVNLRNKTEVLRNYLFHLAFENQKEPDYVTEKLWGTLASGTLPVYLGASNVKDHVPPNSIIAVDDFATTQELAQYLAKVAENRTLYESYHSWRENPLPESFRRKYEFAGVHSDCRMCKWSYAHKYGLGWDPVTQNIRDTILPRRACVNDQGLLSNPLREHWTSSLGVLIDSKKKESVSDSSCDLQERGRTLQLSSSWSRTVWEHDGVTDLLIEGKGQVDWMLTLETLLAGDMMNLIHRSENQYWIQNQQSRVTILTSEHVEMVNPSNGKGTVAIVITKPIRIRILVEDIDTFHEGGDQVESYFATVMRDDFLHPLEKSLVQQV
jgi:hypothetical protein